MTKLNHVLAATDLSAHARHAVERAALVCRETGTPLDLLHVADLAPLERLRQFLGQSPEDLQSRVLDSARGKLAEQVTALQRRYGVTAGARAVAGGLLAELAREAEAKATGLMVCGARGESFMRHLLLGSTAERMLSGARHPILIVKQVAHEPYRMVLVPVDFSPASLPAIEAARQVAPNGELVLLHSFEVPFEGHLRYASVDDEIIKQYRVVARQEAVRKLNALIEEAGLPPSAARPVVLHGDPVLRIVEQEQEQNCDLIVMGKRGKNALESLLLGSVTRRVLEESQGDVLVST